MGLVRRYSWRPPQRHAVSISPRSQLRPESDRLLERNETVATRHGAATASTTDCIGRLHIPRLCVDRFHSLVPQARDDAMDIDGHRVRPGICAILSVPVSDVIPERPSELSNSIAAIGDGMGISQYVRAILATLKGARRPRFSGSCRRPLAGPAQLLSKRAKTAATMLFCSGSKGRSERAGWVATGASRDPRDPRRPIHNLAVRPAWTAPAALRSFRCGRRRANAKWHWLRPRMRRDHRRDVGPPGEAARRSFRRFAHCRRSRRREG
jgi:hypothetical protein